jgi:hypothetical protein
MSQAPAAGRDVLAELDSIQEYLLGLCGEHPQPGLDVNAKDLASRMAHFRPLAQNTVELAAEYASGVTVKDRLEKSMGQSLSWDQLRHLMPDAADENARLREENAQLLARMQTGAESQGGQA